MIWLLVILAVVVWARCVWLWVAIQIEREDDRRGRRINRRT
jgi:hypothetical protein